MSVVERAIDKLRRDPGQAQPAPIGALSNTGAYPVLPESAVPESPDPGLRIVVDRTALRTAGYLPESDQDRRFADEYRQIKRPLMATAFGSQGSVGPGPGNPRLIMMASALPGDGKTFTSINLALSLARERDTTVVLVDADVAKPHISRIFGVENERGLLDALAQPEIDVESLILPTDVGGLSILPAGATREGATELLSSARMAQIVSRMMARSPRRLVLFDSSPLLVTSESLVLAANAGQILLVVRAGKTPRHAMLDAINKLGEGKQVSLVLNQGQRNPFGGLYGYSDYGSYGVERDAPG